MCDQRRMQRTMKEVNNNCWEYMKCGREPGGSKAEEMGVFAACTNTVYDGINKGKNAGRFCLAVAGTFCKGELQGTFAKKFESCLMCPFYREVEQQEGRAFKLLP